MPHGATDNPTASVNLDFGYYLNHRKEQIASHREGNAPSYSFSMDKVLQRSISSMGPLRSLTQTVVSFAVPLQKQVQQMSSIAVGPTQLPELYTITQKCAHLLGIGIPQVFICSDKNIDASTIATDDTEPIILLSSGLIERLDLPELQFVIGHECGHIHNLHGAYNTAVQLMTNTMIKLTLKGLGSIGFEDLLSTLGQIFHSGIMLFLTRWSRCAEITCDRAGLICCGDLDIAQSALIKVVASDVAHLGGFNTQAFIKQSRSVNSTPLRLLELFNTHPLIPKRLEALEAFAHCETFYSWRPKLVPPSHLYSQQEADERCERIIEIINNKNRHPYL
jgi:Zn-dependent protease with chaperone function